MIRAVSWFVAGIAFGLIVGGAAAKSWLLGLLLLVPAVAWIRLGGARQIGLGGLCIGAGAGMAGLVLVRNSQPCHDVSGPDFASICLAPDPAPWLVAAAALVATGVVVSVRAWRRDHARMA